MEIVDSGIFWIVCGDSGGGAEGALAGVSGAAELEARYLHFCQSAKVQLGCRCCRGEDNDILGLDEGKSISTWSSDERRRKIGGKLRVEPVYRKLLSREKGSARREYDAEVEKFSEKLQLLLADYLAGKADMPEVRRVSAEWFRQMYKNAWELGRKASGVFALTYRTKPPSREEEAWFRSAVREELSFWNAYLDDLEKDKRGKFTIPQRVQMYADTVSFMQQAGRLSGLPDNVLLHWFPREKKGVMCPGCTFMVEHSPFPRDLMPTTPRAGDTPCLSHCVHRVVVRFVTQKDIQARRDVLPSKAEMVKTLKGIMAGKIKKYRRKRGKAYNPWLGSTTWGELK